MNAPLDRLVHLRAAGVSVLVDISAGRLPAIVHWGADLGELTAADAIATRDASIVQVPPNGVDVPVRLSVLPELNAAWPGRPGLSGHRAGRDWSARFTVTSVRLDGAGTGQFTAAGAGALVAEAVDEQLALHLSIELELLPSGLLRARARLRNDGAPYTVDDLVLAFPVPGEATELLDCAGRWGKEKVPQRTILGVGTHLRENRRGRTGADAAGALHLGEPGFTFASGRVWAVHTAYSGNHVHYAERISLGLCVAGGGELLLPGEICLDPGQEYAGPWVYGSYGEGLDEVAHRFHAMLRARANPVGPHRPVTLNVWEAVYFDHDLDRLRDLAHRAAALGVERFVLDDGWFGARRDDRAGLGDWVVSPDAWPQGLGPLISTVTGLGMQFGLWFEPEMVNPDSDVARAHPEWIMSARPGGPAGWPVESRFQQVLNIGIPGAYAHVRDQMDALLREYDISYIKWDHNRDLVEAGDQLRGGSAGVHAQTRAYYRLVDELKARHPGLEIESCSSGGARVDLEVMQRCDRVWVSDCIDPLERQQMNRWTMQLLPPEMLGSHIASGRSHTTGRVHSLSFRAGTALLGHLGIEWDLARASEAELDELRRWIGYYKAHRELLLTGDLIRADVPGGDGGGREEGTVNVYGVVSPGRDQAIFFHATTGRSGQSPRPRMRLPGLDPHRRYQVTPVIVGAMPGGLVPPRWWGDDSGLGVPGANEPAYGAPAADLSSTRLPGAVFPGSVLVSTGVQPPLLDPENVVLFEVEQR